MLILLTLVIDFLVATFAGTWLIHSTLAYLLARVVLPAEKTPWWGIVTGGMAFLLTDFAVHGIFGVGFMYLIPMLVLLLRLKTVLVHGATWLFFIGFCGFFAYEALVSGGGQVTIIKIISTLVVGYLTLLGLRGNRALRPRASGVRKVWTPNRRDAS